MVCQLCVTFLTCARSHTCTPPVCTQKRFPNRAVDDAAHIVTLTLEVEEANSQIQELLRRIEKEAALARTTQRRLTVEQATCRTLDTRLAEECVAKDHALLQLRVALQELV